MKEGSAMTEILAIDDDREILAVIKKALLREGYQVTALEDPLQLEEDKLGRYQLILLDVMMPGIDGFDLCRRIREKVDCPILFLTAKTEEKDVMTGLGAGGDDYITKPFKLGVLVSRINALLRRANSFQTADTELQSNGIKVLLLQGQVFKNGELLDLTAAEYKLLCLFMRNPSMVLTKGQILDKLWDCDGNYIDSSTLTVYMRRLRMKIEDNPSEPQMLLTVRGMGYKWNVIKWGGL